MGILLPAALALLALAIPIIIFYMLRLRREELAVSSSLLWRRALQDRTANAPWQRLRRNLLLLLQLLLLLLLVLSLARPFLATDTVASGNMVVVVDASASMQATDEGGRSRFERAREEAGKLVDALSGDARMTLIWAGPAPSVAASATGDKGSLRAALRSLQPSNGPAAMEQAITLASASARQLGDTTVVLISDGALGEGESLPQVPGRAGYVRVGSSGGNVGITSMSLRDAAGGPQLFASVLNSGSAQVDALVSIKVDGELRDSRRLQIAPGDEQTVTLEGLPLDTGLVEADLQVEGEATDLLAADNRAWALRSQAPASSVLLVTAGNGFLEKALNLLPNVKLFKVTPADYAPSGDYPLTVLDAYVPAQLPPGNLLLFAPPDSPLVPVSGTLSLPEIGQVAANDPLLRFVDLQNLHVAVAQRMIAPGWSRVLVRSAGGDPLIMAGEPDGRRVVVVGFDLHQSDLPLQVAFPILLANFVEWLQPSAAVDAPANLLPGEPVSVRPLPEADEIRVTLPEGGRQVALQPSGPVSFADTGALGVYTVQQYAKGQPIGSAERFVVNLYSREESQIAPRPDLAFTGTQAAPQQGATRPLEIWPWVLLASVLLLSLEWWLYNRGSLLPARLRRRTTDDRRRATEVDV